MVVTDAVEERPEVEGRLAHTDHHLWTDHRVIAPHRAECRLIEDTGVEEEVEAAVVDEGVMEDDPGRTHDLAVDHHGEACRGLLTVGLHPEHHQDEAGEEATAGGIVCQGEEAVEAEEGEVPVIAPMEATVVGVGTADERCEPLAAIFGEGLVISACSRRRIFF